MCCRRAPRRFPGDGARRLAARTIAAPACAERRRAAKRSALPRSKRVSMLAADIRIACEMAEEDGTPWQAVINGLRASLPEIWQALPVAEQARFLRHLRPFWDAHRHRLPMESAWPPDGRVRRGPRDPAARLGARGRAWRQRLHPHAARGGARGRRSIAQGRPCLRLHGLQARSRPAFDRGLFEARPSARPIRIVLG